MARQLAAYVNVDFLMSNINPASKTPVIGRFTQRISQVSAQSYVAAADAAARAATTVGVLIAKASDLTNGVFLSADVKYGEIEDTAVAPDISDGVFRFDKFAFKYDAGLKNYQVSIPGRDMGAVTLESDGISLLLTDGAAVQDFVDALTAIGLGDNGHVIDAVKYGFVLK